MTRLSDHRIVTAHAGSLPRPDEIVDMIWAGIEGRPLKLSALAGGAALASDELWSTR